MLLTINKAENNKIKVQNDMASAIAKAVIEAQSTYNTAVGQAATIKANAQGSADATEIRIKTLTNSFAQLKTDLAFTNADLINYQLMSSLEALNLKKPMKVNLDPPTVIKCMSDGTTCPT